MVKLANRLAIAFELQQRQLAAEMTTMMTTLPAQVGQMPSHQQENCVCSGSLGAETLVKRQEQRMALHASLGLEAPAPHLAAMSPQLMQMQVDW